MATMTALHERGLLAHKLIQRKMRTPIVHLHTQMPLADIREWHREIHGRSPSSGLLPSMSTLLPQHPCRCVSTPLTMKAPYGNPRITSLPGMLSVLSWQPGVQGDAGLRFGVFPIV